MIFFEFNFESCGTRDNMPTSQPPWSRAELDAMTDTELCGAARNYLGRVIPVNTFTRPTTIKVILRKQKEEEDILVAASIPYDAAAPAAPAAVPPTARLVAPPTPTPTPTRARRSSARSGAAATAKDAGAGAGAAKSTITKQNTPAAVAAAKAAIAAATLSTEQETVLDAVVGGKNIFLTGAAGTGKTFLFNQLVKVNMYPYHPPPLPTVLPNDPACNVTLCAHINNASYCSARSMLDALWWV